MTAKGSKLEHFYAVQVRAAKLPDPVREHRFDTTRRWRFDFAWPDQFLAVEIEGGAWTSGRHTRGSGFVKDCEKYNAATISGWRVLRFTVTQIYNGEALRDTERLFQSDEHLHYGPRQERGA